MRRAAERDFLVKRTRFASALYVRPAPLRARGKSMPRDPERFSAGGFEAKSVVFSRGEFPRVNPSNTGRIVVTRDATGRERNGD